MTTEISNSDDIIDSRQVIERISELLPWKVVRRNTWDEIASFQNMPEAQDFMKDEDYDPEMIMIALDKDEYAELFELAKLSEQGKNLPDWEYGVTLVRDEYFETYAEELADDIGAINKDASWPLTFIDWEAAADALKEDYEELDFSGVTYWAR